MSKTDTDATDRTTIRKHIRHVVQTDGPTTVGDLREAVPTLLDCDAAAVQREIDELEKHGFIYLVAHEHDDPEVRLP